MTLFAPPLASSAPSRALWFNAFIALLVLLPLPFGANRPWASNLFALLCALLLMAFSANLIRTPETWRTFEGAPLRRLKISATLLGLVALWSFLQTQSWMPLEWHHPLWAEVPPLPDTFPGSISIEPDLFEESLARILAYVACFLFAFFGARDGAHARKLLFSLAIAAVIYAFYGLLMQSTGLHMVLWYKKWWYEDWVTSTFVNKNSYATYAGLGLHLSGLFLHLLS